MFVPAFRPFRILLLAGIGVGISPFGLAQDFTLTPPLASVPPLAPSLTDDPSTAPITTLAIDLLAPQRAYIYDPTGSSLLANPLNPAVYSENLTSTMAETDTALRDASQTGQLSLYEPKAFGAALSFSRSRGAASPLSGSDSSGSAAEPAAEANSGEGYGREGGSDDDSSWGATSSFGSQTAESSWGAKATRASSSNLSRSASSASDAPLDSGSSSESSRSGGGSPPLGTSPTLGRSRSGAGSLSLDRGSSLGSRPSSSSEYPQPNGVSGSQNQERGGGRSTMSRASSSASQFGRSGQAHGSGAGREQNGGASPASDEGMIFSLESRGNPFSQSHVFGETPFSSPGGNGELTFLNPNIFAVSLEKASSFSGRSDRTGQTTLRQSLDPTSGLATSSNEYGLASHPRTTESRLGGDRKGKSKKNPYLMDNEDKLDNAQSYGLEDRVGRP